jgi:putative ABC transport system ATP-binding protein
VVSAGLARHACERTSATVTTQSARHAPAIDAAATPGLRARDVRFRYGSGPWIVDVQDFTLARGEHAVLTGPSGCGKSTFLNLIAGLLDPAQGSILIQGEDIHQARGAARDALRGRRIGMIFQTFNLLLGFSALENVAAPLMLAGVAPRQQHERAARLLSTLGLERHDALVEELSVGQQQRVAVARALACEPTLVLADEPTASLDDDNALAAIDLIREACSRAGASLLLVTHDRDVAARFERRHAFADLAASSVASASNLASSGGAA